MTELWYQFKLPLHWTNTGRYLRSRPMLSSKLCRYQPISANCKIERGETYLLFPYTANRFWTHLIEPLMQKEGRLSFQKKKFTLTKIIEQAVNMFWYRRLHAFCTWLTIHYWVIRCATPPGIVKSSLMHPACHGSSLVFALSWRVTILRELRQKMLSMFHECNSCWHIFIANKLGFQFLHTQNNAGLPLPFNSATLHCLL